MTPTDPPPEDHGSPEGATPPDGGTSPDRSAEKLALRMIIRDLEGISRLHQMQKHLLQEVTRQVKQIEIL